MNEKTLFLYWLLVIFTVVFAIIFGGCVTNKYVDGANGRDIVRALGKLEAECDALEATTSRVAGTADSIEDDIDILRTVLLEYIRGVQRMRADIRQLQEQVERATSKDEKASNMSNIDSSNSSSS